jgi:copper(I)-binding protein
MLRFSLAAAAVLLCTASFADDHAPDGVHDEMPRMEMDNSATAAGGATVTVGDLQIAGAFSRATLPNAPVAGAYFIVTNSGTADDRLIAVSTPVAGTAEIHQMQMEGDVMKMKALPDGLVIPAGGSVTLKPGGYHLMFMELKAPLVEGQSIPVTLTFEKAGKVEIEVLVDSPAAKGPMMDHSMHSDIVAPSPEDFA